MRLLIIYIFLLSNAFANNAPNIKNIVINKELKTYNNLVFLDSKQEIVELNNYKGKLVILNFWATWCAPCKKEMPSLDILYKDRNVFISLSGLYPEREILNGITFIPADSIMFLCLFTWVTTLTSYPSDKAALAIDIRCEQKNQSSVTTKIIFANLFVMEKNNKFYYCCKPSFTNSFLIIYESPTVIPSNAHK